MEENAVRSNFIWDAPVRDLGKQAVDPPLQKAFVRDLSDRRIKRLADQETFKVFDRSPDTALWHSIQREYIDEHSLLIGHVFLMLAQKNGVLAAQFPVTPAVSGRDPVILKIEVLRIQVFFAGFDKTVVVLPEQCDIRIVVPGDESFVADRP